MIYELFISSLSNFDQGLRICEAKIKTCIRFDCVSIDERCHVAMGKY